MISLCGDVLIEKNLFKFKFCGIIYIFFLSELSKRERFFFLLNKMAPSLSTLRQYKHSLICLSGLSVAAWIIIYGKSSNKRR